MNDQLITETSTWQHITLTRDRPSLTWRDSNPQSRQVDGPRPVPWAVWPSGLANRLPKWQAHDGLT